MAGGVDAISGIFRGALWNETIPDRLRGRLAGVEMISWSSGPLLGNVRAGAAAGWFGLGASVVLGGALCVAGSLALAAALPKFWRYTRATEAGAPRRRSPRGACRRRSAGSCAMRAGSVEKTAVGIATTPAL